MIGKLLLKIDRLITYTVLRKNIFYVKLENCIDEPSLLNWVKSVN